MVNKKILFLFFVGMVFLIVVSGFADSWSVQKKIDWGGGLFEWNSNYFYSGSKNVLSCETFWGDSSKTAWHVDGNYWKGYECNKVDGGCVYSCTMNWELDASVNYLSAEITCIDSDNDNAYSNSGTYCSPADCDDGDGSRFPGNPEVCDVKDNNCDGSIDEGGVCSGSTPTSCTDADGDGFHSTGGGTCSLQIDCDDSVNGADGIAGNADDGANRYPGATEICDGIDNDCAGGYAANENIHSTTGTENSLSSCADGFDNDCDGLIDCADPNCPQTNCISCKDEDDDNYCLESSGANCISTNVCAAFGDCVDTPATGVNIHPEATEICDDGIDNDCDTYTDFDAPFCWGAYWASDSQGDFPITNINADGSQIVYLISKYPVFIDQYFATHDFEIYEKDSLGEDDAIRTDALGNKPTKIDFGDRMIAEWTITQADIANAATDDSSDNVYEFYFNISNPTSVIAFQSPILIVDWTSAPCTSGTQSCYTGASGTEGIGVCIGGTQNCVNSVWGACQGEIKPTMEICGDGKDNDCDDEVDEETCLPTPIDCSQYNLCSSATTLEECTEANSCGVSSLNGCLWNSGVCNPFENLLDTNGAVIGQCVYTENTDDDCEDGRLDYLLELTTESPTTCEPKDPVSIFCSAQTSLPLENKFGIFLTIISIIGIYFIFFRIKKILKYKK